MASTLQSLLQVQNPDLSFLRVLDIHIYISKIIPGGSADINGKLCQGDAILRINQIDCKAVTHGSCVDILKRAGDSVKLLVGRKMKSDVKEPLSLELPPPMKA